MMRKVYISGAHSIGKTTLCDCLKKHLRVENAKLIHIEEVGRKIAKEGNLTAVSIFELHLRIAQR